MLSRCPLCGRVVPSEGFTRRDPFSGKVVVVPVKSCTSCGHPYDGVTWPTANDGVVFRSRVVVTLQAEGYEQHMPTLRDGCPQMLRALERAMGTRLDEVFIDW